MKIYNSKIIINEAVERCLAELYYFAQPSVENIKEAIEKEGDSKENPFINKHYLSTEDYKYIVEKYIDIYHLESEFKDHCDVIIRDFKEGYSVNKYIKNEGEPGYRGYESKPSLSEEIGEENSKKVIDIIENRKQFYRYDRQAKSFRFTIMNYSPTSNKQAVLDYWKSQGKEIKIIDRNSDYNYERFYLGISEDEINQLIEEEKALKENE